MESSVSVTSIDREALGRLAELLTGYFIVEDLRWNLQKYSLVDDLKAASNEASATRSQILAVLETAWRTSVFPRFVASLLEHQVRILADILNERMKKEDKSDSLEISELVVRSLAVHGKRGIENFEPLPLALSALGYEATTGQSLHGRMSITLLPLTGGPARKDYTDRLRARLAASYPESLSSLEGAYHVYLGGNPDGYRQACESCRHALELVVRGLTEKRLGEGFRALSGESASANKLLQSVKDFLIGRGPHAEEGTKSADALLSIRLTEDVLWWLLEAGDGVSPEQD